MTYALPTCRQIPGEKIPFQISVVVRLEVVRGRIDSGCSYSDTDNRFYEAVKIMFEPETLKMAHACLINALVLQESTPRHLIA